MSRILLSLITVSFCLFTIFPVAEASKLNPREFLILYDDSLFVFLGEVIEVRLISDRGINGKKYEASIKVQNQMKGSLKVSLVRLPISIGGVKGFDILLKERQKGVFFIRAIEGDKARLTHWGSVAIFDTKYFR